MALQPTFEDILGCQTAAFEWAESYDSKDWARLARCIAPALRIDYRAFGNKLWESLPAAEYIAMISDARFLGNPRLQTQHLIGVSRWEKLSETEIRGQHQMRVAHLKYADDERKEVQSKDHMHGSGVITYRRVEGVWKFAGVEPLVRWHELEGEGLFESAP